MVGIPIGVKEPDWLGEDWLYYRPDSTDSIRPYTSYSDDPWEEETIHRYNFEGENKLYTRPEALEIWREKECKYTCLL